MGNLLLSLTGVNLRQLDLSVAGANSRQLFFLYGPARCEIGRSAEVKKIDWLKIRFASGTIHVIIVICSIPHAGKKLTTR